MPDLTYKGRCIESLTRDELLKALVWAYGEIERMRQARADDIEMEREFEAARMAMGRL